MCLINFKVISSVNEPELSLEPMVSLYLSKWRTDVAALEKQV